MTTEELFREDAYRTESPARVVACDARLDSGLKYLSEAVQER